MLTQRKPHSIHTDPPNSKRLYLSRGCFALVDTEDYEALIKHYWRAVRSEHCFYAIRRKKTNNRIVNVRMHREIVNCPEGYVVHHLNHNTLDNRRENLIVCTDEDHKNYHNFFIDSEPF